MNLAGFNDIGTMQQQPRQLLNEELAVNNVERDEVWTESLAVGSETFFEEIQTLLGTRVVHRKTVDEGDKFALREQPAAYNCVSSLEIGGLRVENTLYWDES